MDNPTTKDIVLLFGTIATIIVGEDVNLEDDDMIYESQHSAFHAINDNTLYATQQNSLSVKSIVKDKAIEIYAKKLLENLKKTLKNSEPLNVGSVNKETVTDKDYSITFQLKNIKLFNLGSFQVKKFKSTSSKSTAEFTIAVPSVKAKSSYEINGSVAGKKVEGKGDAEIKILNVSIDNGKIIIQETPEEIQISSLTFCYNFSGMTIKQTGLNIEGMKSEEVTKFLNDTISKYLKDNKKKICDNLANELKTRVNTKLKGKNRDQLSDLMK